MVSGVEGAAFTAEEDPAADLTGADRDAPEGREDYPVADCRGAAVSICAIKALESRKDSLRTCSG